MKMENDLEENLLDGQQTPIGKKGSVGVRVDDRPEPDDDGIMRQFKGGRGRKSVLDVIGGVSDTISKSVGNLAGFGLHSKIAFADAPTIQNAAIVDEKQRENIRARRQKKETSNKLSYTAWDQYSTVSFRKEMTQDIKTQTQFAEEDHSYLERLWFETSSWIIPALVGFLTAASGSFIEIGVQKLFTWRHGYCEGDWLAAAAECCGHEVFVKFECKQHHFEHTGKRLVTWAEAILQSKTSVESGLAPSGIPDSAVTGTSTEVSPPSIRNATSSLLLGAAHLMNSTTSEALQQSTTSVLDEVQHSGTTSALSSPDDTQEAVLLLGMHINFGVMCVTGVLFALFAALLVKEFAPTARGSGIPEVKTILGGFHMPVVLSARTLFIKCIGLCFVVSAGLSLGKEGPLVHVACCWAVVCSNLHARYRFSHAKVRELLSAAAAAGVSVAFGAPLGGVLFSFEEVSTFFPHRTCSRAFFAAVCAAVSLQWFDPTGTGKLTMFQVSDVGKLSLIEYLPFAFMGVIGGVVGAIFIRCNVAFSGVRMGEWWKGNVPILVEVFCIACYTVVTNSTSIFLEPLASSVIHRLFAPCSDIVEMMDKTNTSDELGLCNVDGTPQFGGILLLGLCWSAVIRLTQTMVTFGTGVPAGLFVPSLYCGACIGRIVGTLMYYLDTVYGDGTIAVEPGVYAMIGAAAVLGGVCRVTISLVVIMFELTGALQHIVSFMLAVQISVWIGDIFCEGIYDCHIQLRKYPFLHEPEEHSVSGTASQIMDDDIDCICVEDDNTLGSMQEMLDLFPNYNGFPLVKCEECSDENDGDGEWVLLGYIHASELRKIINEKLSQDLVNENTPVFFENVSSQLTGGINMSDLVDDTIIRIVPDTPLFLVHQIFHKLGLRFVAVVSKGKFKGLITKKAFVQYIQTHQHHSGPVLKEEAAAAAKEEEEKKSTIDQIVSQLSRFSIVGGSQALEKEQNIKHNNHGGGLHVHHLVHGKMVEGMHHDEQDNNKDYNEIKRQVSMPQDKGDDGGASRGRGSTLYKEIAGSLQASGLQPNTSNRWTATVNKDEDGDHPPTASFNMNVRRKMRQSHHAGMKLIDDNPIIDHKLQRNLAMRKSMKLTNKDLLASSRGFAKSMTIYRNSQELKNPRDTPRDSPNDEQENTGSK